MRVRDWAGTVLVGALIAVAGLLRNHTELLIGLLVVAVVCVALILWDTWPPRKRRHTTVPAAEAARASAVWLSERLSAGNRLLGRWHATTPSYNATEQIREAAEWEHEIQAGLAERLPHHAGHFGVEVGLGPEFAQNGLEPPDRIRLRRRIHRLSEIADRHSREQPK